MKAITKFIGILIVSLLATACATTSYKLPEKYNFDNELTEATGISDFRIDSWESIDYQSLIIRTDVHDYYLAVLQRPAQTLPFAELVGITSTTDRVRPGFDHLVVVDSNDREPYIIEKIYKLKGREQAEEIKKRLK